MSFLMLFDSVVFVHNYDIFSYFYHVALKGSGRCIPVPVNTNLENERLEKFTSSLYTTLGYLSLCRFAGKNNLLAVYFNLVAIGKLYFVLSSLRYTRAG